MTQVKAETTRAGLDGPMPTPDRKPPSRPLVLRPLGADQIDAAFVLMRLDAPDLALDDWRREAAPLVAAGGVLAAWDGATLKGLAFHGVARRPCGEALTRIDRLIAFDVIDPRPVADALVAELARRGLSQGREALGVAARCDLPDEAVTLALCNGAGSLHRVF